MIINKHEINLVKENIRLRPMTDSDFMILQKWNSDKDVLYYSEGDEVDGCTLEDVRYIYGTVSKTAYCFIIELDSIPIGECWLQQMNMPAIKKEFAAYNCRRIDIMIGEKDYWGRGIGTAVINMLTEYAFNNAGCDILFGYGIADYNIRSQKAFIKNGYTLYKKILTPDNEKKKFEMVMIKKRPV